LPYWNVEMTFQSLRFKEFDKASGVRQLKSISALITKGTTPQNFVDKGINFIKIECFENNKIDTTKCYFIDETTHTKELKRSILADGDILFAIAGATIGKCNVVTKEVLPANTNQALAIIRLNKNECREFIYHLLRSPKMQRYIIDNIAVGAQPNLNLQQMGNFTFQYPDIEEQTKIANFLTSVDEKITQLTQKHDLLTQYKKGVMQQIFSQELRFKDDDGRDFPEWEGKTLDEVALSISNGLNLDQSIERAGYMVTRIETISDKKINLEKVGYVQTEQDISNYKLDVGDILFSNINSISHIGKVVFVDEDYQLYHGMNLLRIVINQTTNNAKFVFYQLSSERMKQNFETKANKAVNQASINQTELKKTQLKIPSKPEQTKIANFLTVIDDKITQTQAELAAVKQYKQGLLQQMFA